MNAPAPVAHGGMTQSLGIRASACTADGHTLIATKRTLKREPQTPRGKFNPPAGAFHPTWN